MPRPIDADALLKHKRKICGIEYVPVSNILRAPTLGEESNSRRGVWLSRYNGANFAGYTCSLCGEFVGTKILNQCPKCKTLMDGWRQ